ncbi:MAG: methionyl-tRNA formyltransferase [Deltaproteobacteria bacterium]|nr:methionyl-tRNA formyltransferase [Deltaproteobacteria bacterium]
MRSPDKRKVAVRIVFFGSPPFAVAALSALVAANQDIVGVVTQPDKPAGRGNQLKPPAVKVFAQAAGLDVLQPAKVRDGTLAQWLRERSPDLGVVAAYGRILTQEVLDVPALGCVNLHASLLPRWRGASPIARAIAAGDRASGVCLMQMDAGLDTGAVLDRVVVPIGPDETTPQLEERLAAAGAQLLVRRLADLEARSLVAVPQPSEGVSVAPPIDKHEGLLDFTKPASHLHAQVRGLQPWPGCSFACAAAPGEQWKVAPEDLLVGDHRAEPGTVAATDRQHVWIACGEGSLGVAWLQRPGKNRAPAPDVVRGVRRGLGDALWQTT